MTTTRKELAARLRALRQSYNGPVVLEEAAAALAADQSALPGLRELRILCSEARMLAAMHAGDSDIHRVLLAMADRIAALSGADSAAQMPRSGESTGDVTDPQSPCKRAGHLPAEPINAEGADAGSGVSTGAGPSKRTGAIQGAVEGHTPSEVEGSVTTSSGPSLSATRANNPVPSSAPSAPLTAPEPSAPIWSDCPYSHCQSAMKCVHPDACGNPSVPSAAPDSTDIDRQWWRAQGTDACIDRAIIILKRALAAEFELRQAQRDLASATQSAKDHMVNAATAKAESERLRAELATLRLLKDIDALECSALAMFIRGGDIPNTIEAGRLNLVKRVLAAESELTDLRAELARVNAAYMELIYAVGNKYPNETRHQTALRYLIEREAPNRNQDARSAQKESDRDRS